MKIILLSSLLLLLGLSDCHRSPNQSSLIGKYELQGHDYSSKLIFNGAIVLTSLENDEVKGSCKVVKVAETFRGSVNTDGPCEGKVSGNKITLYLAPGLSDAGVELEGHWGNGRITGTWRIDSMTGGRTFGTFEAVKQ